MLDEHGERIRDEAGNDVFNAVPTTDWGSPDTLEHWRQAWAELCNARFAEKGLDVRIDHHSFDRQGVEQIPTQHEGPTVRAMEAKGIRTDKGDLNRWIRKTNAMLREAKQKIAALIDWLKAVKAELSRPQPPTLAELLAAYTGCTVNFKTYTNSIWDKKQRETPIEKQAVFPNTHERIIEDAVFEKVQEIRQQRHRMTRTGRSSIFSRLVYCADCGSKMNYGSSNNGDPTQDFFDCSLHRKDKEKCKGHFIRVKVLERVVLKHIQAVTGYILRHEAHFRAVMEEQLRLESSEQIRIRRKRLERNENRIAELKRLFIRIYEDNASGRLSDDRFDMLSLTYETEQKQLEAECVTLRQEIEVQERQNENIEKFIQTAHKYVGIDELDGYALRELVSAIYVDAPDKSSGKRVQHIHIKYDGLGFIPLNELMKEETA